MAESRPVIEVSSPIWHACGASLYKILPETTSENVRVSAGVTLREQLDNINKAIAGSRPIKFVDSIIERDVLPEILPGDRVLVKDASLDQAIGKSISVLYLWMPENYWKMMSMDIPDVANPGNGITVDSENRLAIDAGAGIAFDDSRKLTLDPGAGLGINQNGKLEVETGAGIGLDSQGRLAAEPGPGLALTEQGRLAVSPDKGLVLDAANRLSFNPGNGLSVDENNKVKVDLGSGIRLDSQGRLAVNTGNGLTLDGAGQVSLNPGAGLALTEQGNIEVNLGPGFSMIDNRITLASAAYKGKTDFYVNAGGSDLNDGLTAATAFKTLDRALDAFEMFPLKPYMTIHLGEGHFPLPNRTTNLNGLKLLGAGKTKTFLEWDGSLVSRHFNLMFINCALDLKDLTLNLTNIPDDNTAIILDRSALHIVDSQVCIAKVANSTKQGDVFEVANQSYLRIQDSEIDCKNGNFNQLFMFYASAMLCNSGHSFKNAKVYQVLGLVGGSCVYMGVTASTFSNVTADAKGGIYGSTLTTFNSYSLIPGTAAFTVARAGQIE